MGMRRIVNKIAYTPLTSKGLANLSPIHISLLPLLFFTSSLYNFIHSLRHHLYHFRLLPNHRLPVPVISVGNLSWGGNGKTPMVEFISLWLAHSGISPLILTRGYGCADEAKMLQRHFYGTSVRVGVGANRAATAASFIQKYGYTDFPMFSRHSYNNTGDHLNSSAIGVAILDDGMQHLPLWRDVEIVMVNGMRPWGNCKLLPLGPLREPLTALSRADIVVVHHADLILEQEIKVIESTIRENNKAVRIYYTRMTPLYFFLVGNLSSKLPLVAVRNRTVLCVSAVGSADSFSLSIEKVGPTCVERLDFCDHHVFQSEDAEKITTRLQKLLVKFGSKPIVIVTEKDYDRDPKFFRELEPFQVLVLCSKLQIVARGGCTDGYFKECLKQLMERRREA